MTTGTSGTIRRMRTEAGLSIRDLETRTGINRGRLSIIERRRTRRQRNLGVEPTPDELRKIMSALSETPQ